MQPYLQYIVLLGAVVIVGAMVMPRKKQEAALPPQSIQNMETALEQFMENMEKDNEELVSLVKKTQLESKSDSERKDQRISELERKCERLTEQLQESRFNSASSQLQAAPLPQTTSFQLSKPEPIITEIVEPQLEEPEAVHSIHARYPDLFLLYEQGKSIEMISKKLGMNKGEVQLIIQLAKQEVAAHA